MARRSSKWYSRLMKRSYLVPGVVGLIIGLLLGYSLSYVAPDLGARLVRGGATRLRLTSGPATLQSGSTIGNSRCPGQNPNEGWSKTTHAWCQPNPFNVPSNSTGYQQAQDSYKCNVSRCIGDGKKDFGLLGDIETPLRLTLQGYVDDPNSDLYFRNCSLQACSDAVRFNQFITISGYVYEDLNTASCCDGVRDESEQGKPGHTVTLQDSLGNKIPATTNADGRFTFPPVPAGIYYLSHEAPDGFVPTTNNSVLQLWAPGSHSTHDFGVFKQP